MGQVDLFGGVGGFFSHVAAGGQGPAATGGVPQLIIFPDRSVYVPGQGLLLEFEEGVASAAARTRSKQITSALAGGYLDQLIADCKNNPAQQLSLDPDQIDTITRLVDSITSEDNRAVVALVVMHLAIKAICPEQSIRLHKGNPSRGSFSWREGVPMRSIDKAYITPALRRYDLIKLNNDGVMMTRSLAENYPYTILYKGGTTLWLEIVEQIEAGQLPAEAALRLLISLLLNRTSDFTARVDELLQLTRRYVAKQPTLPKVLALVEEYVRTSGYSARIFEVVIHSFMQVLDEQSVLEGHLKPLSQMRSANKKHGNIGDVELTYSQGRMDIYEAWDAKYGKPYLRDELEELDDKLVDSAFAEVVGFITDRKYELSEEEQVRMAQMEQKHGVKVHILSLADWVDWQMAAYDVDPELVAGLWLTAIAASIGQRRRHVAPIDEPTQVWVEKLIGLLTRELS